MFATGLHQRVITASLGVAALVLAGCGGSTVAGSNGGSQPTASGPIPTADSASLLPKAKSEGTLVWYTSNTRPNATKIKELFEATYPGVHIELFQAGGSQVLSKVGSELNGGGLQADVVDYSDGAAIVDQAKDGLFARYEPEHADQIPANLKDPQGFWVSSGSFLTATIAYNTNAIKANDAPTSWKDLLDPRWNKKAAFGSPDYAGTALTTLAGWQKALGADYIDKLGANGLQVMQSFGDVENALVSGQAPVGVVLSFRALADQAEGKPIKVIAPVEGPVELITTLGINAKAAHPNAARLFENFLFTDQVQKALASTYYFPARTGFSVPGETDVAQQKLISPDLATVSNTKYVADLKQAFKKATS